MLIELEFSLSFFSNASTISRQIHWFFLSICHWTLAFTPPRLSSFFVLNSRVLSEIICFFVDHITVKNDLSKKRWRTSSVFLLLILNRNFTCSRRSDPISDGIYVNKTGAKWWILQIRVSHLNLLIETLRSLIVNPLNGNSLVCSTVIVTYAENCFDWKHNWYLVER